MNLMPTKLAASKKWLPLIVLISLLVLFFLLDFGQYLSFTALKEHRHDLISWTANNFVLASAVFALVYIFSIAVSIPGATFLTLAGGFLFGIIWGTVLVVVSASVGATLIFLAIKVALADWFEKRAGGWVAKMRGGFKENAFQYLLVLRFIPIFPFWVVNIVPGVIGVRTTTFISATFIGIIPGSFVYVLLGNGLGYFFDQDQTPNLAIIFEPRIFLPLLALGVLSVVPVVYKKWKKRKV